MPKKKTFDFRLPSVAQKRLCLSSLLSSRVASLCSKLGPSPATFFKGKSGYFFPEKTVFKTFLTSFILKIVLYKHQTPKNREKFFFCRIHFKSVSTIGPGRR